MPIIVITPTGSADSTPYVPQTPSLGTYAQFTEDNRGFNVGCNIQPVAPTTSYDPWADRNAATALAAEMDASEFWDNIDIPYSTYFLSDRGSPGHQTPPPSGYGHTTWDQPIQNRELTPKPVPTIQEPITGSSTTHLYPSRYSYWQNIEKQHNPRCSSHRPP